MKWKISSICAVKLNLATVTAAKSEIQLTRDLKLNFSEVEFLVGLFWQLFHFPTHGKTQKILKNSARMAVCMKLMQRQQISALFV